MRKLIFSILSLFVVSVVSAQAADIAWLSKVKVVIDNDFCSDPDGLFQLAHQLMCKTCDICGITRINETKRLSFKLAFILGGLLSLLGYLFAQQLVNLYMEMPSEAKTIAIDGVRLFLLSCLPFTLNVVLIGYLQSLERYRPATVFMLMRGYPRRCALLHLPAYGNRHPRTLACRTVVRDHHPSVINWLRCGKTP